MLIKTPLTKERMKNHFAYSTWKYMLLVILGLFGWSLIFTVTAPQVPQDKRIDFYAMTYSATQESMNAFLKPIWETVTPEMESVSSVALVQGDEYSSYMQLTAYLAAGDGDIYILDDQFFKSFAAQGAFLPLEGLIEEGRISVGDIDLTKGYVAMVTEYDENNEPLNSEMHLYGIPLDTYYGFMDGMQLDNRNMYAAILYNNQNDENVIPFFDALLKAGEGEKEAWIAE